MAANTTGILDLASHLRGFQRHVRARGQPLTRRYPPDR